jgi:hypothetical protein
VLRAKLMAQHVDLKYLPALEHRREFKYAAIERPHDSVGWMRPSSA